MAHHKNKEVNVVLQYAADSLAERICVQTAEAQSSAPQYNQPAADQTDFNWLSEITNQSGEV